MSLDIYFQDPNTKAYLEIDGDTNITHNLNKIAQELCFYEILWRPEETVGLFKNPSRIRASEILPYYREALATILEEGDTVKHLLPINGWGTLDCFNRVLTSCINACIKYPDSIIVISR